MAGPARERRDRRPEHAGDSRKVNLVSSHDTSRPASIPSARQTSGVISAGVGGEPRGFRLSQEKIWGSEPFWGLGYDWDPDWMLIERYKELRATLIELCQQEM